MSVIDEVRREREDLARVLKKHSGIRKIVEDLYPDSAHFIYELLQNAEDAGATEAQFLLSKSGLVFEHNGRPFEPRDIYAITDIGEGTKANDEDKIGRFGVGFKAVFAYSETPHIWSPPFAFKITDLVLPSELEQKSIPGNRTRFEFPFNNPKKPVGNAYSEVDAGLSELAETTLLFLSDLESIRWQNATGESGEVLRFKHSENHYEVLKQSGGKTTASSHFLKFDQPIAGLDKQRAAVAYALNFLPNVHAFNPRKPLAKQLKIVPAMPGRVAVSFPAEKETSGLRFHLHAPFVPELSRASIKETDANQPLFQQLATLVAASLHRIRDLGLLTVDFLSALPNLQDQIPPRYQGIREAIVREFKNEPLTPTKSGSHAPAGTLYRGPSRIQDVLDDDDLSQLTQYQSPLWAKNPPQENQRDARFLDSLEIEAWGWSELTKAMNKPHRYPYSTQQHTANSEHKKLIESWIAQKEDAWLLRFYALLGEACDTYKKCVDVSDLCIIRVAFDADNQHVKPGDVYLPTETDTTSALPDILFVKQSVYSGGRSESQKKSARSFLEHAGVRIYDAKAGIEKILEHYPPNKSIQLKTHIKHIQQFIKYWKLNQTDTGLFERASFLVDSINEGKIEEAYAPGELCLDAPYEKTGLSDLYEIHEKAAVWKGYQDELGVNELKDFISFIKAIGVMYEIKVASAQISKNPHWKSTELAQDYTTSSRTRKTSTKIEDDYSIPNCISYLRSEAPSASRLIWNALLKADARSATARFRPNKDYPIREAPSQLVCDLKRYAWIPAKTGEFRKPEDMTREDLLTDFPYDNRNGLLTAIGFGENARKRSEEYQSRNRDAQDFGFASADEAEEVAKLIKAGVTLEKIRLLAAQQKQIGQPKQSVPDPERRRRNVLANTADAPSRESVQRERSIQKGINEVTAQAKAYLRAKYNNDEGQLVCQCCHREMPFKLRSGEHFFEAVQCLSDKEVRHYQNRLALCPTCAAMYQYARDTDDAEIHRQIVEHTADDQAPSIDIRVRLAGNEHKLHFVGTHWFDLRTVLSN